MEEPPIADGLKMNGLDRKNSVAFKDPPGPSEHREKERHMIGRADQVWNKQKRRFEFFERRPPKPRKFKFTKYVILVRRKISGDGMPTGVEEVDIRGPLLRQALLEIHSDTRGFSFDEDPPMIDPKLLFHSRDTLEALLKTKSPEEPEDVSFIFEIEAALKYIREDFDSTFTSLSILLPNKQITYPILWTLFPPNTIVYGTDNLRNPRAWLVLGAEEREDRNGNGYLLLEPEYIDYDGTDVGTVSSRPLHIPAFLGAKNISDLPYFPLEYHTDPGNARKNLLEMGRKAMSLHGRRLMEYSGHALKEVPPPRGIAKFNVHGRIMLDPEVFEKLNPESDSISVPSVIPLNKNKLTDEQIMTVNTVLLGFSLGDKIWGAFAVSQTHDVAWNEEIFKSLVLEVDQRDLVHDLVQAHQSNGNEQVFDDVVRGKGKGLVGLLTGPPGVGKTLTAEAVAEVTKRPLYMISSGELGAQSSDVHDKLKVVLELAELWDAVLLLDEADVFLAERNDADLSRNAITSIFLRELEYYQGILILTTNRMKTFDSAFESRIHFCLEYPDLDSKARETVWRNFINKARLNSKVQIDLTDASIRELAKIELNGRQIKNILSVSQAVAMKRNTTLGENSIRMTIKLTQNFDKTKEHLKEQRDLAICKK